MSKDKNTTYWPHMILGFLAVGLTLGYWTIKSANALPVQESNTYMLKYQQADLSINEIHAREKAFAKDYSIEIQEVETMVMTDNIHSNRLQFNPVKLSKGKNNFAYIVKNKAGDIVKDANVSFLLTRPHSRREDVMQEVVIFKENAYRTQDFDIQKAGRYTLQFRAIIGEKIGYSSYPAYLVP
ncbi:hypothetical protein MNB_SV-13-340 [hydrothermal vent metagenome]|uniref:YtkA-like domain-containing protein n=1 Tax=hydrothermal vent metagenome TaxID=652676 RepID=A0A1W1C1X2_9ZZZZ